MREWYRRPGSAERQRASAKRSRDRRIEAVRAYDRERGHRVYNPLAEKARRAINHAIWNGKLERQPCEVCGGKGEAHHDDYEKPFDVQWLCRTHHMELHRKVA